MNISAKTDYAVRALLALTAIGGDGPVKSEVLATAQDIPVKFLENILLDLRRGGLITSHRGAEGGYRLSRPAETITLADVIRAIDGPLAHVRGVRPDEVEYQGAAAALQEVWVAMRAALRSILEEVSLADVASGSLPRAVTDLTGDDEAWEPR